MTLLPRSPADDLETAVALATHQCAALAADVEATVHEAIAQLQGAIHDAERRLEQAAQRVVEVIERAAEQRSA